MKNLKNGLLALLILQITSAYSLADQPQLIIKHYPFNKSLNMSTVYEVTHLPIEKLVPYIQNKNVDIKIVVSATDRDQKNPFLRNLEKVNTDILPQIEFDEETDGMMISKDNSCCDFNKDTIIVRDNASLYTLIHEFLHSQIRTQNRNGDRIGQTFATNHRTLNFRQQKIFQDSIRLVDSRWRRDLLSASQDYADLLYAKIQESHAEEAIIEKELSRYIDSKSPYFEPKRTKDGLQYGENTVNNAIDLYNYIRQVLIVSKGNVLRFRDEIKNNILLPEYSNDLSEEQAQDFAKQTDQILESLKKAEVEIIKLKEFYSK